MLPVRLQTPVDEMVEILERVGALIIKDAATQNAIDEIDEELEAAGAWKVSRTSNGRMQMDALLKAPACRQLLTNQYVLAVTRAALGQSCKRITLKELTVFEVQPGNPKQTFHREDQFWPWHHEPDPWSTNILWAIDDFTVENVSADRRRAALRVFLIEACALSLLDGRRLNVSPSTRLLTCCPYIACLGRYKRDPLLPPVHTLHA